MPARRWEDVRAEAFATGCLDEARVAELGRKMLAEVRGYRLREIRETRGLNQQEIGQRIGISRARVSRIERGDLDRIDMATVRACVEALGGEVEFVAKFGDVRYTIG